MYNKHLVKSFVVFKWTFKLRSKHYRHKPRRFTSGNGWMEQYNDDVECSILGLLAAYLASSFSEGLFRPRPHSLTTTSGTKIAKCHLGKRTRRVSCPRYSSSCPRSRQVRSTFSRA